MQTIDYFKRLCAVPHCSFETAKMREFLAEFARDKGFLVSIDSAGNILCVKGSPKICLQAHYDMVCMGEAPKIEPYEEQGFLKARNSSLGADNGMGVALIMEAMGDFENLECLFTNDEEVGLLGANAFKTKLKAPYLLNLDHENENELIIGCAGGVDIKAELEYSTLEREGEIYELEAVGFKGGHSGIDIIDNPKSALKEMARFIAQNGGQIVRFEGGERINSVAKFAKAVVLFDDVSSKNLRDNLTEHINVRSLGRQRVQACAQSAVLLNAINAFAQGARAYNKKLHIIQTSINLSTLRMQDERIVTELFARSNLLQELKNVEFETQCFFESFGFAVSASNFYAPWQGEENAFSKAVLRALAQVIDKPKVLAVHAGLECGVIEKHQNILCASIGPNIYNPHSTDERCEIASVERIRKVLYAVLEEFS